MYVEEDGYRDASASKMSVGGGSQLWGWGLLTGGPSQLKINTCDAGAFGF